MGANQTQDDCCDDSKCCWGLCKGIQLGSDIMNIYWKVIHWCWTKDFGNHYKEFKKNWLPNYQLMKWSTQILSNLKLKKNKCTKKLKEAKMEDIKGATEEYNRHGVNIAAEEL